MSDGNGSLTTESVAKAMHGEPSWYVCDARSLGQAWCRDYAGSSLYFDPKTGKGGISYLGGTTTSGTDYRDSVSVKAFECTKG
jgi:hypothetical protein